MHHIAFKWIFVCLCVCLLRIFDASRLNTCRISLRMFFVSGKNAAGHVRTFRAKDIKCPNILPRSLMRYEVWTKPVGTARFAYQPKPLSCRPDLNAEEWHICVCVSFCVCILWGGNQNFDNVNTVSHQHTDKCTRMTIGKQISKIINTHRAWIAKQHPFIFPCVCFCSCSDTWSVVYA